MASFMKEFEHLEIQLEDIKSATNNFDESKVIGCGGFGKVYEGEVSHSKGRGIVALKRLDRKHGQGDPQFWKEIMMLSRYTHENLVSLLGFCSKEGEMILVYEHASHGSLERYLNDVTLTWRQRIKICLDAAKGLSFLHEPNERQQRVLHCDIKSANILLDDNLNAKVSDFGLSKLGSTGQQYSYIITNAVGTPGYCDPLYMETYQLTKESDVYSFGVVLFEVLIGKQCVENIDGQLKVHVPSWKKSYKEKKLDAIVFQGLMQQMDPDSLETFADIAYKCLKRLREERPAMSLVVEKLQESLKLQELHGLKPPKEHEEIVKAAVPPLNYGSLDELKVLLTEGFHVNEGKTWLSITEKGEHIERIYIEACLNPLVIKAKRLTHPYGDIVNSRFPEGRCYKYYSKFKARVRGQYLTTQISYMVNLVFRYSWQPSVNSYNPMRYNVDGEDETKVFIVYPTHMQQDGWFIAPLYQFTSQHTTTNFQFVFETCWKNLLVAGFEFQPSKEKVELQVFEEYRDIVEDASQSLFYTTLDELKQILSIGIHLNGYKTWFSLNEKGEHCHMISMKDCLISSEDSTPRYVSDFRSRFPAGLYQTNNKGFKIHVKTQLLSPSVTYTINLAFYASSYGGDQAYVDLKYRISGEPTTSTVYLANERREDWLYIAELYQFTSDGSIADLEITFDNHESNLQVEGILFQPLKMVEDQVSKKDKVENIQTVLNSESYTYWEQKLLNDYEEILDLPKDSLQRITKKELYSILRKGFPIDNGQQWFAVDKHGKKCVTLSARATWVIDDKNSACESSNESRFGEVLVITGADKFEIKREVKSKGLSPKTTYAAYLVFKLPQEQSTFEAPIEVKDGSSDYLSRYSFIYLVSPPHTPIIEQNFDVKTYNPLNRYKGNAIPQQRSDGWMEVEIWKFETKATAKPISMHLQLKHPCKKDLSGLMVQGIELRPI